MLNHQRKTNFKLLALLFSLMLVLTVFCTFKHTSNANAMPFYQLKPQELVLRSEFYTSYPQSSPERKSNIRLASKRIDGYLLDVGGEFSFNRVVGARTASRGYKNAKIIVGGKFVDGVGGGVCQVSTTLYNAVILAGLKVEEYHSHSLPVSYVAPSFDAMVNSGSADLRFTNNTHNPIVIYTTATEETIKISIFGEPMQEKYYRSSTIKEYIEPPEEEILIDKKGEYPDLYEGERRVLYYGKQGVKSEGCLIKKINGKTVGVIKLRSDTYSAIRKTVIVGTTPRPETLPLPLQA